MNWTTMDTWIVTGGILSALACALPGNFLVLRRMSMMGDAISHAVLPGIAIAFLFTGSRSDMSMFVGAAIVGLLTAAFTQWINHFGKVDESASMGVVFTVLFAIGLIIIVRAADHVDLDPGCVLYGALELIPLDVVAVGSHDIPRVVVNLSAVLLINVLFTLLFFKELKISAFDPHLAVTLGINARLMHYALMAVVAVTTVACFESVGSILVIAMLIVPPATAYLLAGRLKHMILLSLVIAGLCAVLGHILAVLGPGWLGYPGKSTNTAGMMSVTAGFFFAVALLAAPRHGLLTKSVRSARTRLQILCEDMLGFAYRAEEYDPSQSVLTPAALKSNSVFGTLAHWVAISKLVRDSHMQRGPDGFSITETGRNKAQNLVRSHRLWESYLHQHLPIAPDHLHPTAEKLEHITDRDMQNRLADQTDETQKDPHGKVIPGPGKP